MTSILLVGALLGAGCGKKKDEAAPPAATPSEPTPTATTTAGSGSGALDAGAGAAATPAGGEVPTEMDFEDEASAKITDKNLEAEVKALEKELEK
ncbi:MAG: hypothetical protein AB7O24_13045 [Kofleriaceae bacterium]